MKTPSAFILSAAFLLASFTAPASEHTTRLLYAARKGDTVAMRKLGIALHKGWEVKRDIKNAIAWLERAADRGDAEAQYYLGMMYLKGSGTRQNQQKASQYLYASARRGYAKADKAIASLPLEYSAKWHKDQAREGRIDSMLLLAESSSGDLVTLKKKQDTGDDDDSFQIPRDAASYYRMALKTDSQKTLEIMKKKPLEQTVNFWGLFAVENKDVDAMLKLADAYGNGNGLPVDTQKAIYFYRMAAYEGNEAAINIVKSLPLDQSLNWWKFCAKQGDIEAILHLAAAYDKGEGIPADQEEAKKYYALAADQGHREALAWVKDHDPSYKTPEQRQAIEQEQQKQRALERSRHNEEFAHLFKRILQACELPDNNEYLSAEDGRMLDIWISLNAIRNGQEVPEVRIPVFQKVGSNRFFGKAQQDVFCVEVPAHLNIHFAEGDTVCGILVRRGDYTYTSRNGNLRSIRNYLLILGGNK